MQNNFTEYLQAMPPTHWVLIEFYAHWCPHWYDTTRGQRHHIHNSQHFRPTYDRIATFYTRTTVHPPVAVCRVDCANEGKLCNAFAIGGYPTMRVAHASALLTKTSKDSTVVQGRSLEDVVQWMSNHLNSYVRKVVVTHCQHCLSTQVPLDVAAAARRRCTAGNGESFHTPSSGDGGPGAG